MNKWALSCAAGMSVSYYDIFAKYFGNCHRKSKYIDVCPHNLTLENVIYKNKSTSEIRLTMSLIVETSTNILLEV